MGQGRGQGEGPGANPLPVEHPRWRHQKPDLLSSVPLQNNACTAGYFEKILSNRQVGITDCRFAVCFTAKHDELCMLTFLTFFDNSEQLLFFHLLMI